jgi:serine/threonine protein kinase/tetratricopeptide (TPR) repeat protein
MKPDSTGACWQRIDELFTAALKREGPERDAFLAESCRGDDALRQEVESLLKAHVQAAGFMQSAVFDEAIELIAEKEENHDLPEKIGSYRLIKEIGRGGMGAVYLGVRDDFEGRRVALKVVKRGMDTDFILRRFHNERITLSGLDHPNIARLIDGGATNDGLPYFAMDYIEGLSIDVYCDNHRLSTAERLKLFREVCSAVQYAHQHLVVHRDIKPGNILVTADRSPKLLDFGIAKLLGDDGLGATVTSPTLRVMTPEYASPEQVRGQTVTTASDIYSLGVLLYELLSGHPPYHFDSRAPDEIAQAITDKEPEKLSRVINRVERITTGKRAGTIITPQSVSETRESYPEKLRRRLRGDLDNIVSKAMRKESSRRYVSVAEFSEDIRRHLDGLPVLARRDTFGYRASKFVRRNRVAVAVGAAVALMLIAGVIAIAWEAHVARAQRATAERRFNDVRHLAHSVLFDYHDAIKDLPGATPVRERLVKDALTYLDSLSHEAAGDPTLQRELAAAYDRVGDVRGQAYSASLGDRAGAMDSYSKALRIREALVAANPNDIQARRELADNNRRIGWQLMDTAESGRGLDHLRRAVTLYLPLTAEQPQNTDLQDEVAVAHNQLGLALEDRGDLSGALDQHRHAMALREKLLAGNPDDPRYRRGLSVTDENIGRALFLTGDVAGALEMNDKARALREALVAQDPMNANHRRILSISYQNDGDYRDQLGDKRGALDSFRKNISMNEELLAADPANAEPRGDLAYSSQRAGDLLAALEDNSQALVYYRKSLQMYEKISAGAPDDLTMRFRLAISRAGIGKIHSKLGERALALEECRKAIALIEGTTEDPTNASHRSMRAEAYTYLGEAYLTLTTSKEASAVEITKHWTAARDMFRRSLSVWEDMCSRGILSIPDAGRPEEISREIAKCDAALRR